MLAHHNKVVSESDMKTTDANVLFDSRFAASNAFCALIADRLTLYRGLRFVDISV